MSWKLNPELCNDIHVVSVDEVDVQSQSCNKLLNILNPVILILDKKEEEGIASDHNLIYWKNNTPQFFSSDKSFIKKEVEEPTKRGSASILAKSVDLLDS